MQSIELKISVEFRSDGKVNKSSVHEAVCNLLLGVDRSKLFDVCEATYAGYSIVIESKKKTPPT